MVAFVKNIFVYFKGYPFEQIKSNFYTSLEEINDVSQLCTFHFTIFIDLARDMADFDFSRAKTYAKEILDQLPKNSKFRIIALPEETLNSEDSDLNWIVELSR